LAVIASTTGNITFADVDKIIREHVS